MYLTFFQKYDFWIKLQYLVTDQHKINYFKLELQNQTQQIKTKNPKFRMHRLLVRQGIKFINESKSHLHTHIKYFFSSYETSSQSKSIYKLSKSLLAEKIESKLALNQKETEISQQKKLKNHSPVKILKNFSRSLSFNNSIDKSEQINLNENLITNTGSNKNVVQSLKSFQQNSTGRSKWLRRLLLIVFVVKLLQKDNVHCDYDINDMMVTMELEQCLLEQEEDEAQAKDEREKKNKQQQKKISTIQIKGPSNQERYGTVEQMLRYQMASSEEFGSVEERMLVKEIQENRMLNKESQNSKELETTEEAPIKKQIKQNLADLIFRPDKKAQQIALPQNGEFDNSKKPALLQNNQENNDEKPTIIESQKKIQPQAESQPTNKVEQPEQPTHNQIKQSEQFFKLQLRKVTQSEQFHAAQLSLSGDEFKKDTTSNSDQKEQVFQSKENNATIFVPSEDFLALSRRVESFLKLRGITINLQQSHTNKPSVQSTDRNNSFKLRLCNKLLDCKDINFQNQEKQTRDVFHHINNFLNPPHVIDSIQDAKSLLKLIQKDESIIGSYIPQSTTQSQHKKSPFDTFSARYPQLDPQAAQSQFNEYKYLSSTKKNCYIIIRNKEVADFLKIPTSKIGLPHILYKYDKELNGKQSEPNCKIDGEYFHSIGNFDKIIQKQHLNSVEKVAKKINLLTDRGFTLINVIQDLHDKIRQLRQQSVGFSFSNEQKMQKQKQKKLFVIKINDSKSENEINNILEKLSKLNKNEVSIVKTQSEALLKSLGIFSNDEYGTMRLFDLEHQQQPIVKKGQNYSKQVYFQRYLPNGPFQVEFLSKWISNLSQYDKPYVEFDRSVNKLASSHPGDFEPKDEEGNLKMVLFYKEGCKGCKLMQDLFGRLVELRQRLQAGESQTARRIKREICLRYRIQDPQQLAKLQISKFNILNDDQSIFVPQTTPTIYLFNQTNRDKVVLKTDQLFNHLNRITATNGEIVQDYMIRDLIEEIEKNVRKFQAII